MKKIIYLAILLGYCMGSLYAQNCVRLISTNPANPSNNEFTSLYPGKINPWINQFNLTATSGPSWKKVPLNGNMQWDVLAYKGATFQMEHPYSDAMGSPYEYLWQAPYSGGIDKADLWWEDGWEILWINTGFYPNGEGLHTYNSNRIIPDSGNLANTKTPYIIMYNRYRGTVRFFANLHANLGTYNYVRTRFGHPKTFGTQKSGIFRHRNNYDMALDDSTDYYDVYTNNKNSNNNSHWWSGDFQLGYDPCACKNFSNLEFEFTGIKSSNINLYGRSISQQKPISLLHDSGYRDFLVNENVLDASGKSSVLYKSLQTMLSDYESELDAYNVRNKSYNAPMNSTLRQLIKSGRDAAASSGAGFVVKPLTNLFIWGLVSIGDKDTASHKDSTTAKEYAGKVSEAVKGQLGKGLDFASVAAFGKDFFKEPVRPSMPTATFTEMRITGTITDSMSVFVNNFITPGSKLPALLRETSYPAYNNVPGLFALLRRPSIMDFKTKGFSRTDSTLIPGLRDTVGMVASDALKQLWVDTTRYALRVKDALKYKLNRALDFDDNNTRIYVSFDVEFENLVTDTLGCYKLNLNTQSSNFYLRDAFPPQNDKGYLLHYSTPWADIEGVGDSVFDLSFTNSFLATRTRTGYMEEHFNPVHGWHPVFGNWKDCISQPHTTFNVKKVTMKILADMYFDQLGKTGVQNNTMQSFTYLLYDYYNNVDIIGAHETDETEILRMRQANLVLTNETIETTDSFVFETKDSVIYVNAEHIELNGTIDVESGFKAVLQATKSIRVVSGVSGNTSVSNKIRLKNVPGFSYYGKITETTQAEVDAFCTDQNNGYKANVAKNKTGDINEPNEETHETVPKINTLVYPNPATDIVNVAISENGEKEYNFQVFDIMGRMLINENVKGANQPIFEINTSNLKGGTYFLRITTPDGAISETHRLVIVK